MSTQLFNTNTERGIRLRDILPDAKIVGADDVFFQSCCGLWKDCQTDDLFVAIMDSEQDGHDFTQEAIARGATAVVTERLLTTHRPQCLVNDSREAYGKICQALAGNPSQRLNSIGVTGTDGKTVTCHLVSGILKAAGQNTGLISSIEVNQGNNQTSVPATDLNSPWLAEQLTSMALANCENAVIEVSSIALARRCLAGVEFDVAILTNIRENHLDFHGSEANYQRAKLRLLDKLKPSGLAIVNLDDPKSHFLLNQIDRPVLTIGIKQEADITAKPINCSASEQTFIITAGSDSIPVRTTIIGDQHIYNCLAATAVGLAQGIQIETIAKGLESVGQIPGRLERIECGQDFGVWIDSARSSGQLAHAIRSIRQNTNGKIWCLCSINEKHSPRERQRLGEIAERAADQVIITNTAGGPLVDYEPAHQILDGFENPGRAQLIPNRFKAIEWALTHAKPNDAVLIAGCGERPFALIGEENWTITDRDVCQAWLYDNAVFSEPNRRDDDQPNIFDIDDYRT